MDVVLPDALIAIYQQHLRIGTIREAERRMTQTPLRKLYSPESKTGILSHHSTSAPAGLSSLKRSQSLSTSVFPTFQDMYGKICDQPKKLSPYTLTDDEIPVTHDIDEKGNFIKKVNYNASIDLLTAMSSKLKSENINIMARISLTRNAFEAIRLTRKPTPLKRSDTLLLYNRKHHARNIEVEQKMKQSGNLRQSSHLVQVQDNDLYAALSMGYCGNTTASSQIR